MSELRLENESLKRHAHAASQAAAHPSLIHELAHSHSQQHQQQHGRGGGGGVLVPRSDLQELERQLRDKAAQVGDGKGGHAQQQEQQLPPPPPRRCHC